MQIHFKRKRLFLMLIFSLQLCLLGLLILESQGITIPLIRQVVGFVLISLIPGFLILKIIKYPCRPNVETSLYAVGLSLATLLVVGFFMNVVYPTIGIRAPLSLMLIILTICIIIDVLCVYIYIRDSDSNQTCTVDLSLTAPPAVVVLCFLPVIAILGATQRNLSNSNTILMLFIILVALTPILVAFTGWIPEKYYSLSIFVVSLALLYHKSLISNYVWGWDIQIEMFLANQVLTNGVWDPTLYGNVNGMLSIITLAPMYATVLNQGLDSVFKIIYPFFFALVPLTLYNVFKTQTNSKIAFFAGFFFISIFPFYTELLFIARQQIAELFLAILLLSIFDATLTTQQKSIFFLVFGSGIITSHYGISFLFFGILFGALIINNICRIGYKLMFYKYPMKYSVSRFQFTAFSVVMLVWYIYMSDSSAFYSGINILADSMGGIWTRFMDPEAAQGLGLILVKTSSPLHDLGKYLQILTIALIVLGYVSVWLKQERYHISWTYLLLSSGAMGLCLAGVGVPFFASALNMTRLYQISLILLSPFCVLGGLYVLNFVKHLNTAQSVFSSFLNIIANKKGLSIFFGLFFMMNSGFLYEIWQDEPTSLALSNIDSTVFNECELSGVGWLMENKVDAAMYADRLRWLLLLRFHGYTDIYFISEIDQMLIDTSYCFLGSYNLKTHSMYIPNVDSNSQVRQYYSCEQIIRMENKIYGNGGSSIFWS